MAAAVLSGGTGGLAAQNSLVERCVLVPRRAGACTGVRSAQSYRWHPLSRTAQGTHTAGTPAKDAQRGVPRANNGELEGLHTHQQSLLAARVLVVGSTTGHTFRAGSPCSAGVRVRGAAAQPAVAAARKRRLAACRPPICCAHGTEVWCLGSLDGLPLLNVCWKGRRCRSPLQLAGFCAWQKCVVVWTGARRLAGGNAKLPAVGCAGGGVGRRGSLLRGAACARTASRTAAAAWAR